MFFRTRFLIAAVLLGASAACVAEPPLRIWWRPGFSSEQFAADKSACQLQVQKRARVVTPTYLDVQRAEKLKRRLFVRCLRGMGYQLYQRDDSAPGAPNEGGADTLEV